MTSSNSLRPLCTRRPWLATHGLVAIMAAYLLAGAAAGCAHHEAPGVRESVPSVVRAFDCTVALYVPPESAQYEFRYLRLGPTLKSAALQTLQQLFADAYEIAAPHPEPGQRQPDFVIVQTVESGRTWPGRQTALFSVLHHAEVRATWQLRKPRGDPLFTLTRAAQGSDEAMVHQWRTGYKRASEAALKKLLSDFADDLTNQHAGTFTAFVARRARTVAFLGWMYPSGVKAVAAILSEQVRQAIGGSEGQVIGEDAVGAALAARPMPLADAIADTSRIVSIARSLKCGVILVGQIEPIGANLRLRLLKFDGRTGKEVARAEAEAQPDDVRGLIDAVESMVSSLGLGAP